MRTFLLTLTAAFALAGGARAAGADDAITKPIHTFIDSFNKNDVAAARATHAAAGVTIIDEVPPYHWVGPKAFDAWVHDLMANDAAKGISGERVDLGDVVRIEKAGAGAYVVVNVTYKFKQKGAAMREPARMTYALRKGPQVWKITGWTWTGPNPTPAP